MLRTPLRKHLPSKALSQQLSQTDMLLTLQYEAGSPSSCESGRLQSVCGSKSL